jgi:DNA-binding Xre family transcriptional regulator
MEERSIVVSILNDLSSSVSFEGNMEDQSKGIVLSKYLFARRSEKGYSVKTVANITGLSMFKINKMENVEDGKQDLGNIIKYCKALNIRFELKVG